MHDRVHNTVSNCGVMLTSFHLVPTTTLISIILPKLQMGKLRFQKTKYLTRSHVSQFSSVQSLSRIRLFATPWIAARKASLSITNSRSSLRLTFIELVMPSSHLILCHPLLLLPPIPLKHQGLFQWVNLPKNTQDWSPSEWTGWISLQSKGLSRDFSNTTVQKHQFFGAQPSSQSNCHIHTWPQEKP